MFEKFYGINAATGITISIHSDNTVTIAACKISTKNNQLDFEQKISDLKSAAELKKYFQPKEIVALNITGKGILHKQVEKIEDINSNNFSQLLPNAAIEDFYVQNFISENQSFVSVIRKTDANQWIRQLQDIQLNVVMLSLGPFPVAHVIPQLNSYGDELIFDGHQIKKDEQGHFISYRYEQSAKSPFPIKIETEKLAEEMVLPYATAFQLVIAQKLEPIHAFAETLDKAYRETVSTKKLKFYGTVILAATFLLLLVNFIIFSSLDAENTKIAYQVSRSVQSSTTIKDSEAEIKAKEQQLQTLGWDGGINKAFLVDQLASTLPTEIRWNEIEVNPVDIAASRIQKSVVFKDRQIKLNGNSANILPVNEWMARMKTKTWVKDIQLESYTFNAETNTGQFILIITY